MENKYPAKSIRAVNYALIVLFFFFSIWFSPTFASYLTDHSFVPYTYKTALTVLGGLIAFPC
ncbi:MAG: hypothetical protein J6S76_01545, partial [Clostridia bacterium]|nr:hypothetical protein [Clostridia bacterium]